MREWLTIVMWTAIGIGMLAYVIFFIAYAGGIGQSL